MPEDAIREELARSPEHRAEPVDQSSTEATKKFVKPTLTRHASLPVVTAGIAAGGSP